MGLRRPDESRQDLLITQGIFCKHHVDGRLGEQQPTTKPPPLKYKSSETPKFKDDLDQNRTEPPSRCLPEVLWRRHKIPALSYQLAMSNFFKVLVTFAGLTSAQAYGSTWVNSQYFQNGLCGCTVSDFASNPHQHQIWASAATG